MDSRREGRSSRAVCQRTLTSRPKYSCATLFRIPRMSAHGISGVANVTRYGIALAASPMTTMA
jgi:hypothetical protein